MRAVWLQDYADENRNGGVLARGAAAPLAASPSISEAEAAVGTLDNDDLLGALEAKAAALVKVGGKVEAFHLEFDSLALSLAIGKR